MRILGWLTLERVRDALVYDVETGEFTWRERPRVGVHRQVGTVNQGRRHIHLGGRQVAGKVAAHRLAWFYCFGEWPIGQIDQFVAQIKHNYVHHYLGIYSTADEAHQAYLRAKRRLHVNGNTL